MHEALSITWLILSGSLDMDQLATMFSQMMDGQDKLSNGMRAMSNETRVVAVTDNCRRKLEEHED